LVCFLSFLFLIDERFVKQAGLKTVWADGPLLCPDPAKVQLRSCGSASNFHFFFVSLKKRKKKFAGPMWWVPPEHDPTRILCAAGTNGSTAVMP